MYWITHLCEIELSWKSNSFSKFSVSEESTHLGHPKFINRRLKISWKWNIEQWFYPLKNICKNWPHIPKDLKVSANQTFTLSMSQCAIKISIEYLILCKNINNETTARNSTMLSHNVTTRCQTGRPSNPYKPYVNEVILRGQNPLLKCCWPLEFLTQLIKV